jgi:hypothetical protein
MRLPFRCPALAVSGLESARSLPNLMRSLWFQEFPRDETWSSSIWRFAEALSWKELVQHQAKGDI